MAQTPAVVHAWRPSHWYTNIYEVGAMGHHAGTTYNGWAEFQA
jgi:hypothetical protein